MRHVYHDEMKIARQEDSRANQKARTRAAIVAAAAEQLRRGSPPSVAEAAEAARVSKATAYRYFPTQEALLLEVAELAPATQPVEELVAALPEDDVGERLRLLLDGFGRVVLAEEPSMRSALRVSLDTWLASRKAGGEPPSVREGRRMRWIDEAVAPLRSELSPRQRQRLRCALALTMGVEPVVVMKDVCRIEDEEEIVETLQWAAATLLAAVRAEPRARRRS